MRRFFKDMRGVSAVEFGLVLPLFLFLTMAIIDLGRFAMMADSMEAAVLRGARSAMVASAASDSPATTTSVSAIVTATARVPDSDALNVNVTWQNGQNVVGSTVTVQASYQFDFLTPEFFISFVPQTITRQQTLTIVN